MNQNCFICHLAIGISARNCVKIFAEYNNLHLQSGNKLYEVVGDIVDTQLSETEDKSNVICKKCHKACIEYDSLKARLQSIKNELSESYKKSLESYRTNDIEETKPVLKDPKKIVLPASKLQPLPANYVIEMGKLAGRNIVFPKIENVGSLMPGKFLKMANHLVSVSTGISNTIKPISVSPIKMTTTIASSPSKVTEILSDKVIVSSLMQPTMTQNSIVTKRTKNPVMSFNVNLPKDFLTTSIITKSDDPDNGETVKKEIVINALADENENNDEQAMEIDEDCSLAVVPVTTDENGKLVFEGDKIDLKKNNSSFFDVGLLLEGDSETQTSEREEKYILDKLQILNENLDDDDSQAIVMEEGDTDSGQPRIIRVGQGQQVLYDGGHLSLVPTSDDLDNDQHDSNDESQIELQVSGDEETANAIIAAAQEQGGAFIKVQSGEMYRVQSVHSRTPDENQLDIVEAIEDGQFKCLLCERKGLTGQAAVAGAAAEAMSHAAREHGARVYICALCGAVRRRRGQYARHIEEHAQQGKPVGNTARPASRLHICTVCGKTYNSRTLLAEHAHAHSGERPYACATCGKAYASKYTLQAHLKTHEDRPRPFKCKSCGKAFLTQQNLNQHEKTHSGVKEFVCKVCSKAFATQHNLEVHCVVHTGKKPFSCGVCGKAFARRAELKDHGRIHTGERPFSCDICGASFTQRSNLHSHKRATHFDDKRYHCTHCPKRFKRRRLLEYHIKSAHTGERPLQCTTCRATFVYPEHYKKHMRIHSGERPYDCEVCGKSFNSRDNRNMHRFVHSDKKPYECLACGAGYMRKQLLYAHMNATGHVAESIVVNQPKVITSVENVFETSELDLDENEVQTAEDDGTTKLFITEADNDKIVIDDKSINVVQVADGSAFLNLDNLNELIDANVQDKLDDQTQIVTTDEKGNTMRLIQVQLPDGKSGWVAINN